MTITKKLENDTLTIALEGRLDTTTAPQFETEVKSSIDGISNLIFDFEKLVYVSSAGLRVILTAQKLMGNGKLVIKNVCSDILEVFEITGFNDILTIEK